MQSTITKRSFKGILWIGDPHVATAPPGRRKDDYLTSVLSKLEMCGQLCRQHDLLPVITGDLFHLKNDTNIRMLNRLTRVLKGFPVTPLCLAGNHDNKETWMTDADALMLLSLGGTVHVLEDGSLEEFVINGQPIRLYGVPHGSDIPKSVPAGQGAAILATHHDLAFGSAYPGAAPLVEIPGVAMVVNGHMHATKPMVRKGQTAYHNPGNIEPLSIDLEDHIPRAWMWDGANFDLLTPFDLPHGKDLFNRHGMQAPTGDSDIAVDALLASSKFAAIMQEDTHAEANASRTNDATILGEDMEHIFTAGAYSEAAQNFLRGLRSRVVSDALVAQNAS